MLGLAIVMCFRFFKLVMVTGGRAGLPCRNRYDPFRAWTHGILGIPRVDVCGNSQALAKEEDLPPMIKRKKAGQ